MWWKTAGFGRFMVLNKLNETEVEKSTVAAGSGDVSHDKKVHEGALTKIQVGGISMNTLSGMRRPVILDVLETEVCKPGIKREVNLSWGKLFGPPVPDSWSLDYEISAPGNDRSTLMGRIPLKTPRGGRPMLRFTFRYHVDDDAATWYAVQIDSYDWRNGTWDMGDVTVLGDAPAVHA